MQEGPVQWPRRSNPCERPPVIRRRTLLTSALAVSTALGAAACGSSGTSTSGSATSGSSAPASSGAPSASAGASKGVPAATALKSVTVSPTVGQAPKVTFTAPLAFTGTGSKIITRGTGAAIHDGDCLGMHTAYIGAQDGATLQSSWEGGPGSFLLVSEKVNGAETVAFLTDATVGSRVAMAGTVSNSSGEQLQVIQVSDIVSVALKKAQGTAQKAPAGMPTFTVDASGKPTLTGRPSTAVPRATSATVTVQGTGAVTKKGDTLAMHYSGWKLGDGAAFDSSWGRGEPFSFTLGTGGVIKGWDTALVGKKVGSQVLMVIPPAEAYGTSGNELSRETLIFVADILGAVPPIGG